MSFTLQKIITSNTTAFDCLVVCVWVWWGVEGVGREKGEIGLKGSEKLAREYQATAIRSRKFELFLAVL